MEEEKSRDHLRFGVLITDQSRMRGVLLTYISDILATRPPLDKKYFV